MHDLKCSTVMKIQVMVSLVVMPCSGMVGK